MAKLTLEELNLELYKKYRTTGRKPIAREVTSKEFDHACKKWIKDGSYQNRQRITASGKPALSLDFILGVEEWITLSDKAWDIMTFNKKTDVKVYPYEKHCFNCGSKMNVHREFTVAWAAECPNCKVGVIDTKDVDGGTFGAGVRG